MLSGMQDEIVPKEHMRALWDAVVARRGKGVEVERRDGELKEEETERAKYMEFEEGGHSESFVCLGNLSTVLNQTLRRYVCAARVLVCHY